MISVTRLDDFWKFLLTSSVTRWLDYFSVFHHLQKWKFVQFVTLGSKVCRILTNCQNLDKTFKILPKLRKFAKSGHTADKFTWKDSQILWWLVGQECKTVFFKAKTPVYIFGLLLQKIGLHFISTSGHTANDPKTSETYDDVASVG